MASFIDARLAARGALKLHLADDHDNVLDIFGDPDWRSIEKRLGGEVRSVAEDAVDLLRELGQGWTITVDRDGTSVREGDRIWLALPLGVGEWAQAYDAIQAALAAGPIRERTVA